MSRARQVFGKVAGTHGHFKYPNPIGALTQMLRIYSLPVNLDVETGTKNGTSVVTLRGEIDVYTAPRLRQTLIDLVDGGATDIVVDMEKVDFLDSTGLGVLVGGLKRVKDRDGSLKLVANQDRILKIFDITGLARVFPIFGTLQEALDS
jgi:anti-sigma B factor antagonist